MVHILQFSDEEKQRIGVAQQIVVRGVLGLLGRVVGGILGGGSAKSAATAVSEKQVIVFLKIWLVDIYKNAFCLLMIFWCFPLLVVFFFFFFFFLHVIIWA